ncbi:hypothetical protein K437DRAFT_91710 [Tilletiaria anomala UBC 951]|uniref:Uncharacterized protein n=1 Tax=Tilletiaria anomala (strain ATCC 24038 / CBS 436.72 / UBC 951) TaxID=1037660 RepID=A0A066W198_TILAU|nr:uncharacterized protein K437DRAFT_91710 [Tilletiaria anomala UBC 951]KDN47742.1 hypothetical protein K437DRAFT_91710 [Tilletiaria anomala UBC 951]
MRDHPIVLVTEDGCVSGVEWLLTQRDCLTQLSLFARPEHVSPCRRSYSHRAQQQSSLLRTATECVEREGRHTGWAS